VAQARRSVTVLTVDEQAIGPFTPFMDFVVRADATGLPCGQEFRSQFAALDVVEA
jgi:hypothetical protein